MRTRLQFLKKMLIAFACLIPITVMGQIEISNETQLRAIANDLAGDYKLVSDITLTQDWVPIGNDQNRFTGTIDGNGKTIYRLKFSDSSINGAGFVGVAEGAIIENLRIVGAQVLGGQDVGGIVGRAYAPTTVEKCYTSGYFVGNDHIGGIIGGSKQSGSAGDMNLLKDCFSTAAVISLSWQAGGMIGAAVDINITNTYFAGVATCPSGRTGGIVALPDGGSTKVERSVSLAPYLKGDEVNRVIGNMNGYTVNLANNYSWEGTQVYVKGEPYDQGVSDASGLDGEHKDAATLRSTSFYAATLGWNSSIWKFENGKYPIFADQSYPLNGDAIYISAFPERALPGNMHQTNALSALGRTVSCVSSNPAVATVDANGLVAFLANGSTTITFTTTGDSYSAGATLSYNLTVEGISYNITTEDDLRNIKYDLNGEYTLMNNITLTKDWTPIGTFRGKLNGNGKIIYGLRVDDQNTASRGLFSETEGAEITKLGIENAYIIGNENIGAIVGNMKGGLIDQCYVVNSYVAGRDHVGSIAGAMRSYDAIIVPADPDNGVAEVKETRYATVRNCHAGAQVYSREYQAGGISGIICGGTIEKCYFSGAVQSMKGRAAGIVSLVDSGDPGEIKNNLNLAVSGYCGENTYRIADWGGHGPESGSYSTAFTNNWSKLKSYFGTDYKNSAVQEGQKDNNRNGGSLTDDNNARSKSFYTSTLGWDFSSIWKFASGTDGKLYPVLAWQTTPLVSSTYGIPEQAYLTWYANSMEAIDLDKIITTTGQTLTFSVASGNNLVDLDGSLLYVTDNNLTSGGIAVVNLGIDPGLSSVLTVDKSSFNVEVILRDAYNDIYSVQDLLNINNKLFAKFRLKNNIDLTGIEFRGIGTLDTPFMGEFNGNGFVVINPTVKTDGNSNRGFFNATDGAKILKVGIQNINFTGVTTSKGDNIGGLVGSCKNTTIEECFVKGEIKGNDHVGGFVGGNSDNVTIKNSYADVTINAGQQAGGFFGVTAGSVTVQNSYYTGSISAVSRGWAGGVIGLIDKTGDIKLSGCVSIGNLSSVEVTGYHIGGNMKDNGVERGTISLFLHNLYNIDATLTTNGTQWVLPSTTAGVKEEATPVFPANLKKQSTYTAIGWDFSNVWSIKEGTAYPQLKNLQTSGISENTIEKSKYSISVSDKKIYVSGIENEAEVTAYNLNGQVVFQSVVTSSSAILVPHKGLYLLKIVENGSVTSMKVYCGR